MTAETCAALRPRGKTNFPIGHYKIIEQEFTKKIDGYVVYCEKA
jgi:hypothetical protein